MEELLAQKEKCWWSIKIQLFEDKWHFLQYAGRYVRRPPIAQRRITWIGERNVGFWFKDKKLRRRVEVQCSLEEFVDRWAQHIPERYQHAVSSFGLFAPRALQANFGGHFCNSGTGAKTTAPTSALGGFAEAGLSKSTRSCSKTHLADGRTGRT